MLQPEYDEGVRRLAAVVADAAAAQPGGVAAQEAGLRAALDFLAADPPLTRLLLIDAAAPDSGLRDRHEANMERLASVLQGPASDPPAPGEAATERGRLLAAGLVTHLAGRVLAGEAERLAESQEMLVRYLLAPSSPAVRAAAEDRRVARA